MAGTEVVYYPVMGEIDGQPTTIARVSEDEILAIERSRGEIVDPYGFEAYKEPLTSDEFFKAIKDKECAEFPLPRMEWVKKFWRLKRLEMVYPDPVSRVFYNLEGDSYVENIVPGGDNKYYTFKLRDISPDNDEINDYNLIYSEYKVFLDKNDMEVPISTQDGNKIPTDIVDNWSRNDKLDVFSNITEEQRTYFVIARWIAAVVWMPAILMRIKGYLRLGHSVDDRLLKKQADTLIKTQRFDDGEESNRSLFGAKR